MGVLSILGEIVLGIGGLITGNASSNLKAMSRDKRFSDEDREKCSNLSEGFTDYTNKMNSKADELRERRYEEKRQKLNQEEND